ncbi:MAG: DUF5309 family protein [Firmicutes bacterium]|nr:DUF5309 family protein [Bacillota bacterium]MCM1401039.1 DUF5309 family protein [Bacteroides sp.]MCM1476958.1 DUF5309 family protein [Bacteroides sp.]
MTTNSENTVIVNNSNSSVNVVDGPLTTGAVREGSPSLLLNEIDSRVVKVRPMATPVDQISRLTGARPAASMVVDYYSVDTKSPEITLASPITKIAGGEHAGHQTYTLKVKNGDAIAATETLMLNTVAGSQGVGHALVLYVVETNKGADSSATVICLNIKDADKDSNTIGKAGAKVVRMGRAAGELDVQTPQFESLPVKSTNYCQIFKAQVEQSALTRLSAKEVGWTLSDQEEVAIMDMRLGMEKSFLFGVQARLTDPKRYDEVLFTQGIWHQAGDEFSFDSSLLDGATLIQLMRKAFTGDSAGSSKKILMAGSGLIEALNNLDYTKVITSTDTVTYWGIDFTELRSKFGSLCVVHNEVFDQCGHEDDGLVIDPQYLTKYSHIPFRVEHLDLKSSGVRNTDALVVTEASCLVLRHPKSHLRVTMA